MTDGAADDTVAVDIVDVFGVEWPRIVAILVRDLGDLALAEDSAQDAFIEASTRWATDGVPDRPGAWLLTAARRRAIDRIRRERKLDTLLPLLGADAANTSSAQPSDVDDALDEQLALLVGCCHPALAPDAQVALTLRVIGGLSAAQIARAFFVTEPTMTRRLTRAKDKVRNAGIPFIPPTIATLEARLPAVCGVIYSIFTEGHTSARSEKLVRGDLCDEAIWLGGLLASLVDREPEILGLQALMLLVDARRDTRVAGDGTPVLLADQDRSRWDQAKIASGLASLARAHACGRGGMFQFQAAVAALHATAASFDATDWHSIIDLYDVMLRRQPTKLIGLNRAVAVSQIDPSSGLRALDELPTTDHLAGDLSRYTYFHAARADVLSRLGRHDEARSAFDAAIGMCTNDAERRHLIRERDENARFGLRS